MIKVIEIRPQTCDMGSNYEKYEFTEPTDLGTALDWIENNIEAFGTVTIKFNDDKILRKFDYDLYHNDKKFYFNLNRWEEKLKIKEMASQACFMNCDFTITLS